MLPILTYVSEECIEINTFVFSEFVWLESYFRVPTNAGLLVSTLRNRWCSSRVIACYTGVTCQIPVVTTNSPKEYGLTCTLLLFERDHCLSRLVHTKISHAIVEAEARRSYITICLDRLVVNQSYCNVVHSDNTEKARHRAREIYVALSIRSALCRRWQIMTLHS